MTVTTRLVDTAATPVLLKAVIAGTLDPGRLITPRFTFADMLKAYDAFGHAARDSALKVVPTAA